jgi:capsular polysaccharide transport system permease protein
LAATRALRSPLAVTLQVWRALFLREAVARLARNPAEWFWVLAEPIGHIALLMWLFVIGFRQKHIVGGDVSVFIMLGVVAFFLPRNLLNHAIAAVGRGEALYGYRQVKPVDTVIARAGLESLLWCVMLAVIWAGAALFGFPVALADPVRALAALGGLWLAGIGLALTFSVLANLNAQIGHLVRMLMGPLYLFSAVFYPSARVPITMRDTLLLNPMVHGIESLRLAFMPGYQVPSGIDLLYLYKFAVVMIFLGLALHARFQDFLRAR